MLFTFVYTCFNMFLHLFYLFYSFPIYTCLISFIVVKCVFLFNVSKVCYPSPWSVGRKHRSTPSPNTPHNTIQTPPTPTYTIILRCCCKTRHHMCIFYMQFSALPCCRTRHHMCIFYMQLSALPKFKKQQTGSTQIIHATRHRQTNGCACVCLSGPFVCCCPRVVN